MIIIIHLILDACYVSASEAAWRLFHYKLHNEKPDIMRLQVHLPGQHTVIFQDNESLDEIVARENNSETTLTAWFKANQHFPAARELTYGDFPTQWVYYYNRVHKEWKPRQRGNTIG